LAVAYHHISSGALTIPVPNVAARTPFTCGASALLAVSTYYGVGPDTEKEMVGLLRRCGFDRRAGTQPHQLKLAAEMIGLRTREYSGMSRRALLAHLRRRQPVLLTIQAWGRNRSRSRIRVYKDVWSQGHWVVAIGFDDNGVFLEDPSLEASRGYLPFVELDACWHDTGRKGCRILRYGLVLWKPNWRGCGYLTLARQLE